MSVLKDIPRAVIGLLLIFIYHIPRLVYLGLLVSYASVFARDDTLTADPKRHLKNALRLLRSGRHSNLLYAALELRLALERVVDFELSLTEGATRRMLDGYDPVKKLRNLRRLAPESTRAQEIFLIDEETSERLFIGRYEPINVDRVSTLNGRLGDLLHIKVGLPLGISSHPWYQETRALLEGAAEYLLERAEATTPFMAYSGLEHVEVRPAKE